MELQFDKKSVPYLGRVLMESQAQEVTQELRLNDGMPDIGRVICAWSQPILRSKEWRGDYVALTGGLMVRVLYAPEDGSGVQWVESWLPFQMKWPIQGGDSDGMLRMQCCPGSVDARTVSARKIMVRGTLCVLAEAYCNKKVELAVPPEAQEDIQLLRNIHPLRLTREIGEKEFQIEEELPFPDSAKTPDKLVNYAIRPEITEQDVSGDKVVFRGNANVHVIYLSEDGELCACDLVHSFSQLAHLDQSYDTQAEANVRAEVTSWEAELTADGKLSIKCSLVGQYAVDDSIVAELVEDAYSTIHEVKTECAEIMVPAILEKKDMEILLNGEILGKASEVIDVSVSCGIPDISRAEDGFVGEQPVFASVVYRGEDGLLHGASARWEEKFSLATKGGTKTEVRPGSYPNVETSAGTDGVKISGRCAVAVQQIASEELSMISGMEIGDQRKLDPNRPSVILRRVGDNSLWDLAKQYRSTVSSIMNMNHLEGKPDTQQMLLIPIT